MKTFLAILFILGAFFGAYQYIDNRYALSANLGATQKAMERLEQRLDQKMLSDQLKSIQDRIWKIEDRCGKEPKDPTVREELRKLYEEKRQIEGELNALKAKQFK